MTNLKLNQVIALEKGAKADANGTLTRSYHTLQKSPLFAGQERTYQPKDEDGEQFPPEPVKLQRRVHEVLTDLVPKLSRWFDVTATKDAGNQIATADVIVDGTAILTNLPVTTLLFLEKQLGELATVVSKLPVLDASENWTFDSTSDRWRTEPVQTTKSKKMPRTVVKAPATDKHPAQVDLFLEDSVIGSWSTVKLSGAIPEFTRQSMLAQVQKLQAAVKVAREQANMVEVQDRKIGEAVFAFLGW